MATCPICGEWIDKFDLELSGGHRECLENEYAGDDERIESEIERED